MTNKFILTAFSIVFAVSLSAHSACAGLLLNRQNSGPDVQVRIETPAAAELANHKTYAWTLAPEKSVDNPKYRDLDLDTWVREAVDRQLQSKGYVKLGLGAPEMWLTYAAAIDSTVTSQTIRVPTRTQTVGHPRAGVTMVDYQNVVFEDPLDKGSLAILIYSGADKKRLWQASAQGEVQQKIEPQTRKARLENVVSKIMASVPQANSENNVLA